MKGYCKVAIKTTARRVHQFYERANEENRSKRQEATNKGKKAIANCMRGTIDFFEVNTVQSSIWCVVYI